MNEFALQAISIILLMVVYNLLLHRIVPKKYHLPFALISTSLVVLFAYQADIDIAQLGFQNIGSGLLYGGVMAIGLNLFFAVALSIKATRSLFVDARVDGLTLRGLARRTLIDIPLTTVLFEEVLFRGLIIAILQTQYEDWWAIVGSSILFGLWHIMPAMEFAKTNKKASGFPLATILGTVLFTAASGLMFGWLRIASGSIIAPMLLHFASNSGSYLASWLNHHVPWP